MSKKLMKEIAKIQEEENRKLQKILRDGEKAISRMSPQTFCANVCEKSTTIERYKKQSLVFA